MQIVPPQGTIKPKKRRQEVTNQTQSYYTILKNNQPETKITPFKDVTMCKMEMQYAAWQYVWFKRTIKSKFKIKIVSHGYKIY